MRPSLFIASSVEQLPLAYAVQEELERDLEPTVWTQGVFGLSGTALRDLMAAAHRADFACFVFAPDDVTALRGAPLQTVRDNVVFELGLFIGRLGVERCYLILPRGTSDLRLPTDLVGLNPGTYDPTRKDGNLRAALGPACNQIRASVRALGARIVASEAPGEAAGGGGAAFCTDPDDCTSLIESWMGQRPGDENLRAMRFDDVDRDLKLAPGSARLYIEQAAARWGYVVTRRGKDTILFEPGRHRVRTY